ncbi:SLAM family member 5-like isoform X1 [Electrophorus electricus]|uniref:SLAM family member 5-like isoform X1 n=1 Tax=Electrophorus electricus TaxID=8005 RepID=UPI0015D02A83|nr:SLAM family member 5-like isoform X1 [Electrophorus electricus]
MLQTAGILIVYLLVCYQAVRGNERSVAGYLGGSVILPSGADPTTKLVAIRWSIYNNVTFIATFSEGEFRNKYWKYKDRLELNTTTGDLEIKYLQADDDLRYTVLLEHPNNLERHNYVTLTVREKLRTPSIHIISRSLKDGFCTISLSCTSEDNVTLSWKPEQGFSERYLSGKPNQSSNEAVLWTSFSPNRNITFSCTATDGDLKEGKKHNLKCQEDSCHCQQNYALLVFLLVVFICLIVGFAYKYRAEIGTWFRNYWNTAFTKS